MTLKQKLKSIADFREKEKQIINPQLLKIATLKKPYVKR